MKFKINVLGTKAEGCIGKDFSIYLILKHDGGDDHQLFERERF